MTGADRGVQTGAALTSNGFQASIAGGQYIVSKPSIGPWGFTDKDVLNCRNGRRFLDWTGAASDSAASGAGDSSDGGQGE